MNISKISKKLLPITLVAIAFVTVTGLAAGDDPVISLSYLNDIFMPKVETKIKENSAFTVVTVNQGQTFLAREGCEFILRSGQASINASQNGGISDTTDGVDLQQGAQVPKNHLLIVPRDDGRGFSATSNVIIMVKGSYVLR